MNKVDLNYTWGHLCDTDKLVDDMMTLLTKYGHKNSENGVCSMLHTYFINKSELIDMFQKSKRYAGDMRIVLDVQLERTNSASDVRNFCSNFAYNVDARSAILKYEDSDGKSLKDYFKEGTKKVKAKKLCYNSTRDVLRSEKEKRDRFTRYGNTVSSEMDMGMFDAVVMGYFRENYQPQVTEYLANGINNIGGPTIAVGMKTSRAFNKMCIHYGVDKLPEYNKLFARYSDMVSGLKRNMKFFISVNPLDYLTMSFGNSWASCHTIDRTNERGMSNAYRGEYCGGTVSYMLDSSSFITYAHDSMPESVETGKVYRNMFHFDNGLLVQGRIYPQGNDGATDLYKTFRGFVQDELAELLELNSTTWVKRDASCSDHTKTCGVHYPDYYYGEDCNVSYPKEMSDAKNCMVIIGHKRICPNCGELMDDYTNDEWDEDEHDRTNKLTCHSCE